MSIWIWLYLIFGFCLSFLVGLTTASIYDQEGHKMSALDILILLGIITTWPIYLFFVYRTYKILKNKKEE